MDNYLIIFIMLGLLIIIARDIWLLFFCAVVVFLTSGILDRPPEILDQGVDQFTVEEINTNTYIVSKNYSKYVFYSEATFRYGDVLELEYNAVMISKPMNFNEFDYKSYMNSKNIKQMLFAQEVKVVAKNFNIKNSVINHIDKINNEELASWVKMVTLGMKDYELSNTATALGISHLFAISGFHIGMIYNLFKKLIINEYVLMIIIGIYVWLTGAKIGSIRAYLFIIFVFFNNLYSFKYNKFQITMLSFSLCLMINNAWINDVSFYLSFVMSYSVLMLSKYKYNKMTLSIALFSISLPLTMLFTSEINLLTPFVILIISPIFIFLYPLILLISFIPNIELLNNIIHNLMTMMINSVENIVYSLRIQRLDALPCLVIIIILIIIYSNIKLSLYSFITIICLTISGHKIYNLIFYDFEIHMINVGQADCFLIKDGSKNYLIDVGVAYNKDSYNRNIKPYLISQGISVIDKIFISHDDSDHNGGLVDILNDFKVKKIYNGDFNNFYGERFSIKQLNKQKWDNNNNSSQVLELSFDNKHYLFTGDIYKEVEQTLELQKNYEILKVSHHGSSTSTGIEFMNKINVKYSFISVGENNYGHPHEDVLDALSKTTIYSTIENGTVIYKKNLFGYSIKTLYKSV